MKKYVYELHWSDEVDEFDVNVGLFTSLPEVRAFIVQSGDPHEKFYALRHPLNPEGAYDPVEVEIFRK